MTAPRCGSPCDAVGACVSSGDEPSALTALARPKSRTLTTPSGVILMFAGFRSRWTMPLSWATSRASAICRAIATASGNGKPAPPDRAPPLRDPAASVSPSTSSSTRNRIAVRLFEAVDRADVGMIQRGEHPRLALEAREPIGMARERARQDLDRDVAPELGVARPVHLAHAARAEQRVQVIPARSSARSCPAGTSGISAVAVASDGAARNPSSDDSFSSDSTSRRSALVPAARLGEKRRTLRRPAGRAPRDTAPRPAASVQASSSSIAGQCAAILVAFPQVPDAAALSRFPG